jgi:type I restriction enzyme M protein
MVGNNGEIEKRLWDSADEFRANSKLKASEYSIPVLGLLSLRHADYKFTEAQKELEKEKPKDSRRGITKLDYQACGVLYLPEKSRYAYLLNLPERENIGEAINNAMKLIEEENEDLKGILPKNYTSLENSLLITLLRLFSQIPLDKEGDMLGRIYEYFLGKFAMSEGQKAGEFYTPTSIVKLIVEVIEPFHGKIYDPACGSGGMFVQSARFVENHRRKATSELSIYGQEKTTETVKLCKMNLAVHGLSGDIKEGNTYYEDIHNSVDKFDYVMANPPFNVDRVDYEKVKSDPRWLYGLPSTDNANYLWIQLFYSTLNSTGRSGFVMANSASDARGGEAKIRQKLIEDNAIDVMIAIGPNFFYTVTLPCTLWFMDKGKKNTDRKDRVLFIDARNIFTQIDRAHREFTPEQIDEIAGIVRSYRKEKDTTSYADVKGLCKVATKKEIEEQGWSLNPGRYVGVAETKQEDYDYKQKLEELNEELEKLNIEAHGLEDVIARNVTKLLE